MASLYESYDLPSVLNLYPEVSGFTCVGITQRGLRCRQSFIAHRDLQEASNVLTWLRNNIHLYPSPVDVLPTLRRLAELTLCPRWHRYDRPGTPSQAEAVATRWLNSIQTSNSTRTYPTAAYQYQTQPSLPSLLPQPNSNATLLPHLVLPQRYQEPAMTFLPVHSTTQHNIPSQSSWGSQTQVQSTQPMPIPLTRNYIQPSSSPPSNIQSDAIAPQVSSTSAEISLDVNPSQVNLTITVSFNGQNQSSTTVVQHFPANARSLNTTISFSSVPSGSFISGILSSPQTTHVPVPPAPVVLPPGAESSSSGSYAPVTAFAPAPPNLHSPLPPSSQRVEPHAAVLRRPLPDTCCVCLETINNASDAVWCRSTCGQNICTECFETWNRDQSSLGRLVRCVYW
ncbi:hypothetical protein G7Y89_g13712 [Cudoniella acicularis]|uniref:RING-type domain-containing protein n=1 Tax=Cudoniella acicularis TaxID=354080 RepID=A0A8H4R7Q7_9HELO|nr:hypothetical protein G7Y89_g13712 [Cudoniella acicularis]